MLGGDGETRTLAPVSRPTPLAGAILSHSNAVFWHYHSYKAVVENRLFTLLIRPETAKVTGFSAIHQSQQSTVYH